MRLAEQATEIGHRLVEFAREFDGWMEAALTEDAGALTRTDMHAMGDVPARLLEAMRYSALAPGKRVRPYVLVRACELCGGSREAARPAALAIECVHAFSLIHDDLPAMDDDDMRRGQPTNHRRFDEATAILAGDGLLALSFELLASGERAPRTAIRMVQELARASGPGGMIGGQMLDIEGETQTPDLTATQRIHAMKTAQLFAAAARMGALSAGADEETCEALARFGHDLGLTFQIADDLLDLTARSDEVGKRCGKDRAAGKQTYPACIGEEASRREADQLVEATVEHLSAFGPRADDLRALARLVLDRRR